MGLRIKEICKEKGLSITDVAEKLGMDSSNLYSSLKGNPSLKRLTDVANALNVGVGELFEKQEKPIFGCLYIYGEPIQVSSKEDLQKIIDRL